jgi:hypothetical protein
MHDLLGAVLIVHADFAKVVLRKLSGEAFESHQRRHDLNPQRLRQGIGRAFPAGVPSLARPMEQLRRPQRRLLRERRHQRVAVRVGLRRPADLPSARARPRYRSS